MSPAVRRAITVALVALALAVPFVAVALRGGAAESSDAPAAPESEFPVSRLRWDRSTIGPVPEPRPLITNVQVLDFDGDGRNDVVACDALENRIVWYRQRDRAWEAHVLGDELVHPAHATVFDCDGDRDLDVAVAVLGDIWPSDAYVGQLILLENRGSYPFARHVLLDDVRRVADAQPADFDGDGDLDLAVAVFGYLRGEVLWLENRGGFRFREHVLLRRPGAIHVPVADVDGDGDPDFVTIVSQEDETVWGFENVGQGQFRAHRMYDTVNFDLGSAGLVSADLDQDGDADFVLPVGDNLEDPHGWPQPYHGCLWLENLGGWEFATHRIARFGGTYAAAVGDIDGDGDLDIALASWLNDWADPSRASIVWLENDGRQQFRTWQVASEPTRLVSVACADLNGDGRDDLVAGGLHLMRPYDRLGSVTAWISRPPHEE